MHTVALDRDVSRVAQAALRVSMLEGALHAVMVGVAESYLGAFAVELGHGPRHLALLATLPLMGGAVIQLLSPALCAQLGSRKRVAIAGALGQATSLGVLMAIAAAHDTSFWSLLAAKLAFWISGGSMAPAWNAWMASLTLHTHRPRYFARRSALNHVALLLAFGAAGAALHRAGVRILDCFVALFAAAAFARFASAMALLVQPDIEEPAPSGVNPQHIWPRLQQALVVGRFRVAVYVAALGFGTQVAAPFFTPYMLRELALDYRAFAGLSALSILAKALTFPCCHRMAERVGLRSLLRWSGVGVALIPVVWASSPRLESLVLAHLLGGAAWAAVEYASFQLLLESAPAELTAEFFSLSSALTGMAHVAGAWCGGQVLVHAWVSYSEVFWLSALLRALPLALLFIVLKPEQFPARLRILYTRLLSVRPVGGAAQRPILAAIEPTDSAPTRTTEPPRPL